MDSSLVVHTCVNSERQTPSDLLVHAVVDAGKKIPELDFKNQVIFKSTRENWVPKGTY